MMPDEPVTQDESLGAAASWGGPDDPVEDGETWPEFPPEPVTQDDPLVQRLGVDKAAQVRAALDDLHGD